VETGKYSLSGREAQSAGLRRAQPPLPILYLPIERENELLSAPMITGGAATTDDYGL